MKRLDFLRILGSIPFFGSIVSKGAQPTDKAEQQLPEIANSFTDFAEKDSLLLYRDGEAIACTVNADLLMIDNEFTINVSGRLFFDSSHSMEDLMQAYIDRAILRFRLARKDQTDNYFDGEVLISSISGKASLSNDISYDIVFSGIGSLTLMDEKYEEEV